LSSHDLTFFPLPVFHINPHFGCRSCPNKSHTFEKLRSRNSITTENIGAFRPSLVWLPTCCSFCRSQETNQRPLVGPIDCTKASFWVVHFSQQGEGCFHRLWRMEITRTATGYKENASIFSSSSRPRETTRLSAGGDAQAELGFGGGRSSPSPSPSSPAPPGPLRRRPHPHRPTGHPGGSPCLCPFSVAGRGRASTPTTSATHSTSRLAFLD